MISMTGFSSLSSTIGSEQKGELSFFGSLKSVNSRYFEAQVKLPSVLQVCEVDIVNNLRTRLVRGKCSINIACSNQALLKEPLQPDIQAVRAYLNALDQIQQATGIQGTISISDIASNSIFFSAQEISLSDEMKNKLYTFVNTLIDGLIAARIKEGSLLKQDIIHRTELIKTTFEHIHTEAHRCFKHKEHLIQQQLEQLLVAKETEIIRYQLSAEASRADVTEEIVRFDAHLQSLVATIHNDADYKGKQLDFILQELGREINTIAAKSSSAALSNAVITVKVELEKIREQVQNIV